MQRKITIFQLTQALLSTERNIRDREGSSLPRSIPGVQPREYMLGEVLWMVHGQEREQILRWLRINPDDVKAVLDRAVSGQTMGYIPDSESHDSAMF